MTKEFNLSDKIYDENYCPDSSTHWMKAKDVREAIRRLRNKLKENEYCSNDVYEKFIKKIFGDDLID